ncbi:MAG: carbohydrate porin [Xanthobacteraceae bacterium]
MSYNRRRSTLLRRVCAAAIVLGLIGTTGVAGAEEKSLAEREKLTGDWGGVRGALEARGITFGVEYTGEILGISGGLWGGEHPGRGPFATYEGLFTGTLDVDLEKFMGWTGGKFHAKGFQINNAQNLNAADYVGSLADPSNIDAYATTRLFTLWFEQNFGSFASIRVGQLAADDEFLGSDTAGGLINGTFGWATIMSSNLPSGGPAYPLAAPGVRLQINPAQNIALLGAVFSGDPAGKDCYNNDPDANPQICNRYGTTFSFSGGAFWIGEAQYNINKEEGATGLPGSYKIGAWYHTGKFADQRFGVDEFGMVVPLALNPAFPLYHRGDWGIYGVIDQTIWRGPATSVSVFLRGGLVPADRNLESWYIDGGVGMKGLLPGRADDTLTVGFAYSKISPDAIGADQDLALYVDPIWPRRSGEPVLEVSYIAQVTPWWTVQPDFQVIWKPGGNVPIDDEDLTLGAIPTAYLFGVRSKVIF